MEDQGHQNQVISQSIENMMDQLSLISQLIGKKMNSNEIVIPNEKDLEKLSKAELINLLKVKTQEQS